nr:MAG TPA: hypothetical protein [Caudoviricetes sp.]
MNLRRYNCFYLPNTTGLLGQKEGYMVCKERRMV